MTTHDDATPDGAETAPEGPPHFGENLCPECNGSGAVGDQTCTTCGGSGKVMEPTGGE